MVSGPLEVVGYDPASGKRLWWISGVSPLRRSRADLSGTTASLCAKSSASRLSFSFLAKYDKNKDGKDFAPGSEIRRPMTHLVERIDGAGQPRASSDRPNGTRRGGTRSYNEGAWPRLPNWAAPATSATREHVPGRTARACRWMWFTPCSTNDLIYVVRDGGILTTFEASSGRTQSEQTPAASQAQQILRVADRGRWQDLPAQHRGAQRRECRPRLDDFGNQRPRRKCWATPAICDGRLFVRTDKSIYCFGT